jgi:lipopolysaccharide export system permease protein
MRLYKTIDIYITKKFLGTFFYAIALILSIAVVFDMSENLDEFLSKNISWGTIISEYYLNFIPYFANLFSPLFTFIAVIYFTSKMAYNTEIIAILSSGVSYTRLMRPYMVSAFILGVFSFTLGNYVIPPANETMNQFRQFYIDNNPQVVSNEINNRAFLFICAGLAQIMWATVSPSKNLTVPNWWRNSLPIIFAGTKSQENGF